MTLKKKMKFLLKNLESEHIMEMDINDIPFIIQEQTDATNNLALDKTDVQVLFEFCINIKKRKEEGATETFIAKINITIEVLMQHFGIEQNELGYVFYTKFNDCRRRFTSTSFVHNGGRYCYIVADEIRMKIFQPSVCKSVACLLTSYYV
ncbi:PREDICTED: uncharacterized protein LOC105154794 [Acromyrmex echinatior]|uniref:uncharacterized protein LOC105154794 n=1 Tax=Acromyrmex echinatior TaxID=103372 RepID=UPI000580D460|nr:PREDICTED: uncharacterized protein LOC105154794 [Acromyrmex echinatior]